MAHPARESPASEELDVDAALTLLSVGDLEIEGRLVDASNTTLYTSVTLDGVSAGAVYKPVRGERPLWDFPDGTLAGREVAAYAVARATGWGLVPPTVLRDGPLGVGMCQLWITSEDISGLVDILPRDALPPGWRPVVGGVDDGGHEVVVAHADDDALRRLAVLDAVLNNADRKGGHLLLTAGGTLFGVDHGVSFHAEPKLRTLLWGWAGEPLTAEAAETLARLSSELGGDLGDELAEHLTSAEVRATAARVDRLIRAGRHPRPGGRWPAVPWPAF
jgi:uncharacterized repeat protein (TIGR03843 family)